tara:strand:- start:3931 stop:5787 length:1857 start_codon:yes stop_codon:yes gene_type:complete
MFAPLRNHSHYSLLLSTSRCNQIAEKCAQSGYKYAGLTDLGTVSGCVNFIQACKKHDLKPIIGSEITLKEGGTLTLICKNNSAWRELLVLISLCNDPANYNKGPEISFGDLVKTINPDNFVVIDGYVGSYLFNNLSLDWKTTLCGQDYDSVKDAFLSDWESRANKHLFDLQHVFKSYYLEVNLEDFDTIPVFKIMAECVASIDPHRSITIPDSSSYYCNASDSIDHRVLLCVKLKTTLKKLDTKMSETEASELSKFIRSSKFHIKNEQELSSYDEALLSNMQKIVDQCEDLTILSNPRLPKFDCPEGMKENDYLKQLCRDGWAKLFKGKLDKDQTIIYRDRVLKELAVIEKANLAGYFLIVQDYVNHFRNKGCLIGPARGSGGGSLVCYLTGITLIDPIKYDLLFERFYNEGRNTEDHISLPDIDVDFPPDYREGVIKYLNDKYGSHRVCQMLTFGRLAGRSILKEVLRVNEACSFDEMNEITSRIPNEAAISDLLENMDNPSVIRWALEYDRDSLADYCYLDDDDNLVGEYSKIFEQAMRMEGIFKTQGKHAAGVVIASDPLDEVCPMVKASRSEEKLAGMEMGDLEAIGCVKFDILGVNLLKKISETVEEINYELS